MTERFTPLRSLLNEFQKKFRENPPLKSQYQPGTTWRESLILSLIQNGASQADIKSAFQLLNLNWKNNDDLVYQRLSREE